MWYSATRRRRRAERRARRRFDPAVSRASRRRSASPMSTSSHAPGGTASMMMAMRPRNSRSPTLERTAARLRMGRTCCPSTFSVVAAGEADSTLVGSPSMVSAIGGDFATAYFAVVGSK